MMRSKTSEKGDNRARIFSENLMVRGGGEGINIEVM